MSICLCYHDEQNFLHECGVCYGTKEKEPCSCGGNPTKCDFYEEVREKYIHQTHADKFRSMSDEELAEYFPTHASLCPDLEENKMVCKGANFMADDEMCRQCWLNWLKQDAQMDIY